MHTDIWCVPYFPFHTCPSTYTVPNPLADLSQQCPSCQQHSLHSLWCRWPQWEEFPAAEGEISKPKPEMSPSHRRLQCEGADFSVHLFPWGCGSLETKSQGYLYAMLIFCTKIFSLVTKHYGSWFLPWSYFKQGRSCTKAAFGSELSGIKEIEKFKQHQEARGSSNEQGRKEGAGGYVRRMQTAVGKSKWWYSGVGCSLSLLLQLSVGRALLQ